MITPRSELLCWRGLAALAVVGLGLASAAPPSSSTDRVRQLKDQVLAEMDAEHERMLDRRPPVVASVRPGDRVFVIAPDGIGWWIEPDGSIRVATHRCTVTDDPAETPRDRAFNFRTGEPMPRQDELPTGHHP